MKTENGGLCFVLLNIFLPDALFAFLLLLRGYFPPRFENARHDTRQMAGGQKERMSGSRR
jgi:hypothetical protein